jgi:hypothetical protein
VLKECRGGRDIPAFEPARRREEKISLTPGCILEEVYTNKKLHLPQSLA